MMRIAIVVLIGRWVDLYLMVIPSTATEMKAFEIWEVAVICCIVGVGAICCIVGVGGLMVFRSFAAAKPVPSQDPYLSDSLHYHVE